MDSICGGSSQKLSKKVFCPCAEDPGDVLLKNVPKYRLPAMIGNWVYERAILEGQLELYEHKLVTGQLLSKRTKDMLDNTLEPVLLSAKGQGVQYKKAYQICAAHCPTLDRQPDKEATLYLSGLITELEIGAISDFQDGCKVTGSYSWKPVRRNTWVFEGYGGGLSSGDSVRFGDKVYIKINKKVSDNEQPLYLKATCDGFGAEYICHLSVCKDGSCLFRVLPAHPTGRSHYYGVEIASKTDYIIQHVISGRNLAVESAKWFPSFFGLETRVTCHTYRNSNRIETAENLWQICDWHRKFDTTYIVHSMTRKE